MPYNLSTMQSIFCNNKEITEIRCNGSLVYQKQSGPDYSEPFYVENTSDTNETLEIIKYFDSSPTLTIEYKTDNTEWTPLGTTSTTALTLPLAPGEKIYLRCNTNVWNGNKILGISKVGGNIMSLLYGSNFNGTETSFPSTDGNTFPQLFYGNNTLQDASNLLLPATTLTFKCYAQMFSACTSMTSAPSILPATALAVECYSSMFIDCSSLTKAPDLPATTLVSGCYYIMFNRCYLLNEVKCLATTGLNEGHTNEWLNRVASTGTFYKAAGVTWPTGTSGIPEGWTVVEA